MAADPFRFFRGTCHLFYEDLRQKENSIPFSPICWVSGDLHLENFGTYKGDNRLVYFDLNDFDEGLLAPASWEIVRMVTSIFVGCKSLGFRTKDTVEAARFFLEVYAKNLSRGKARYLEAETTNGIVRQFLEKIATRKQRQLIKQRTIEDNGRTKLKKDKVRLFGLGKELRKELLDHIGQWLLQTASMKRRFRAIDCCFRVAGTGSLGVRRYVFLLQDSETPSKYFLLDMKQALPSSLLPWVNHAQPAWHTEAHRVVTIQDRMQNICPALLTTTIFKGEPYVLKEMQPVADKIDFLVLKDQHKDLYCVIEDMALLAASAQLRSSGRQGAASADELIAFGQSTEWQQELIDYAMDYAHQVENDYKAYFKHIKEAISIKNGHRSTHPAKISACRHHRRGAGC